MKVQNIQSVAQVAPEADKQKTQLVKASKEFESILVKQLLSSAKVLGKSKSGYGDMALDALAKGITDAGGIGLARKLEDSVARQISDLRSVDDRRSK